MLNEGLSIESQSTVDPSAIESTLTNILHTPHQCNGLVGNDLLQGTDPYRLEVGQRDLQRRSLAEHVVVLISVLKDIIVGIRHNVEVTRIIDAVGNSDGHRLSVTLINTETASIDVAAADAARILQVELRISREVGQVAPVAIADGSCTDVHHLIGYSIGSLGGDQIGIHRNGHHLEIGGRRHNDIDGLGGFLDIVCLVNTLVDIVLDVGADKHVIGAAKLQGKYRTDGIGIVGINVEGTVVIRSTHQHSCAIVEFFLCREIDGIGPTAQGGSIALIGHLPKNGDCVTRIGVERMAHIGYMQVGGRRRQYGLLYIEEVICFNRLFHLAMDIPSRVAGILRLQIGIGTARIAGSVGQDHHGIACWSIVDIVGRILVCEDEEVIASNIILRQLYIDTVGVALSRGERL